MSPTARTLEWLRKNGYIAGIVERVMPRIFTKSDLFGFCDIIAVPNPSKLYGEKNVHTNYYKPGTIYVQTTTATNHAARRTKILGSAEARVVLAAHNAIWIVSWKQTGGKGGRWSATVEEITLSMFEEVA